MEADNHTGCLVLFQQSEVAAITGDDTVLAGLAAQDPYAVVPDQRAFTAEPYGLGIPAKNVDFVRFVNARLAQMRSNGEWTAIYNRWLADSLGPAPARPGGLRQDIVSELQAHHPAQQPCEQGRRASARRAREPVRRGGAGDGTGAPSRMGVEVQPTQALTYLEQLGQWRDGRRAELDQLDQAALQSPNGAAATGDITLSMALWRSRTATSSCCRSGTWPGWTDRTDPARHADLGPAGHRRRLRPRGLAAGGLPAVGRAGLSLRVRLGLEVSGAEITERVRLRAQMERIRDQVTLEPAGAAQQQAAGQQARLARRLKEIADKAARGGDVGGLLGPLEIDAATFERDLIVGGARRRGRPPWSGGPRTAAPSWRPGRPGCGPSPPSAYAG